MRIGKPASRGGRPVLYLAAITLVLTRPGSPADPGFASPGHPLSVRLEWRRGIFGSAIGAAGMRVIDLDRDGATEIVSAASNRRWWTASLRDGRYEQDWVSGVHPEGISSLAVANVDGDAAREVLVATGSSIRIYDGAGKVVQGVLETGSGTIRHLQVADLDRDGYRELVFCTPAALYIYDSRTGAQLHADPSLMPAGGAEACTGLAVGNVDGDAAWEVVLANGSRSGYVIDGVTRAMQWTIPGGFGTVVRVGDVDGEGTAEIVAATPGLGVRVFDAVRRTLIRTVSLSLVATVELADLNGDGAVDLMAGQAQWGDVHVWYGPALDAHWSVRNFDHWVTGIAAGDADGDGLPEIVFGGGFNLEAHLYVVDAASREIEWRSQDVKGPFYGIGYGDVDADGRPDLIHTAYEAETAPWWYAGQYFRYATRPWSFRHTGPPDPDDRLYGLSRLVNANVDGDPQREIIMGGGESSSGRLSCYDGRNDAVEWRADLGLGAGVASLRVADVDGDGALEVIVGTRRVEPGDVGDGAVVVVLDAATGHLEWRSPELGGSDGITLLRTAQLDGDAALEIVAGRHGAGDLFVVDVLEQDVRALGAQGVTALDTPDRDRDGLAEIVVATSSGDLRVVDPGTGALLERIGFYGHRVEGLAVGDFNRDDVADYAFSMSERVHVLDGRSKAFLWTSELLGMGTSGFPNVAKWDSLLVADVDRDGSWELVVNTGDSLDVFELGPVRVRRRRVG